MWSKGNSYCVFNLIDENTSKTPWMIYKKVLNPLSKLRSVEHLKSEIVFKCKDKKGRNFSYRRINLDDLDLFHSWHHLDHVKEFWELNISKSELKKYIEKMDSNMENQTISTMIKDQIKMKLYNNRNLVKGNYKNITNDNENIEEKAIQKLLENSNSESENDDEL